MSDTTPRPARNAEIYLRYRAGWPARILAAETEGPNGQPVTQRRIYRIADDEAVRRDLTRYFVDKGITVRQTAAAAMMDERSVSKILFADPEGEPARYRRERVRVLVLQGGEAAEVARELEMTRQNASLLMNADRKALNQLRRESVRMRLARQGTAALEAHALALGIKAAVLQRFVDGKVSLFSEEQVRAMRRRLGMATDEEMEEV